MDFAAEVQDVLRNLSGNRQSIKGIKSWFMQRAEGAVCVGSASSS